MVSHLEISCKNACHQNLSRWSLTAQICIHKWMQFFQWMHLWNFIKFQSNIIYLFEYRVKSLWNWKESNCNRANSTRFIANAQFSLFPSFRIFEWLIFRCSGASDKVAMYWLVVLLLLLLLNVCLRLVKKKWTDEKAGTRQILFRYVRCIVYTDGHMKHAAKFRIFFPQSFGAHIFVCFADRQIFFHQMKYIRSNKRESGEGKGGRERYGGKPVLFALIIPMLLMNMKFVFDHNQIRERLALSVLK